MPPLRKLARLDVIRVPLPALREGGVAANELAIITRWLGPCRLRPFVQAYVLQLL
jgi:hypothetical protein